MKRQVVFSERRIEAEETKWIIRWLLMLKRQMVTFLRGLKLKEKYFGRYRFTTVKTKDHYDAENVGIHEGPSVALGAAIYLKPWVQ